MLTPYTNTASEKSIRIATMNCNILFHIETQESSGVTSAQLWVNGTGYSKRIIGEHENTFVGLYYGTKTAAWGGGGGSEQNLKTIYAGELVGLPNSWSS